MINAQLEQAFRRNKLNASLSPFWRNYRKRPLAGFADASIANLCSARFLTSAHQKTNNPGRDQSNFDQVPGWALCQCVSLTETV